MYAVEIKPSTATAHHAGGLLAIIDYAAELGAKVDLPEVRRARKHLDRLAEIEADTAALHAGAHHSTDAAQRYYQGDVTLDALLALAARQAPATTAAALEILEAAVAKANHAAAAQFAQVGDRWVDALRPTLAPVVDQLADLAAAIPPDCIDEMAARSGRFGREVTVQWAQLNNAVAAWDEVHGVADAMRVHGMIPVTKTRYAEDFRWRNHDRLTGSNVGAMQAHFILQAIRNGAQPGIFTETEIDAAAGAEQAERADEAEAVERERREAAHRQAVEARQAKAAA